jgi:hypothetical protein
MKATTGMHAGHSPPDAPFFRFVTPHSPHTLVRFAIFRTLSTAKEGRTI